MEHKLQQILDLFIGADPSDLTGVELEIIDLANDGLGYTYLRRNGVDGSYVRE